MSKFMKFGGSYLVFQAVAGLAWWLVLALWPESRAYFLPTGAPEWPLLAFWLADLVLFVGGSLVGGILLRRGSSGAGPILWFTAGAVAYGALYCLGVSLWTNSAWWSVYFMAPAMLLTFLVARVYEGSERRG